METHSLVCHPDTPAQAVQSVEVQIAWIAPGALLVTFVAVSGAGSILIPAPAAQPGRMNELWKTTCFETFIRCEEGAGYYEFNFAPNLCWAAYSLAEYRSGMIEAAIDLNVEARPDPHRVEIRVTADLAGLPGLPPGSAWQIALSAVIEEVDGTKSYWALAHPHGEPDFHHPTCFTAFLPAPDIT